MSFFPNNDTACRAYLNGLVNAPGGIFGGYEILQNSGWGAAQAGNYYGCEHLQAGLDATFCTASLLIPNAGLFHYNGCCLPTICTENPQTAQVLGTVLCRPFMTAINSLPSNTTLPPILSMTEIQCGHSRQEYTAGSVTYIVFLALLALFVLIFSIPSYLDFAFTPKMKRQSSVNEGEPNTPMTPISSSTPSIFYEAFSFRNSWNALTKRPIRNTNFLDGVRTLSMLWVILGHTHSSATQIGVENQAEELHEAQHTMWFNTFVVGAFFSVDSFFWLSAFLAMYIGLKKFKNMQNPLGTSYQWGPFAILRRYLRLTPAMMAAFLFYWLLIPLLVDAPHAQEDALKASIENCKEYWYIWPSYAFSLTNEPFTYIACNGHLWYLSVEFVCFLFLLPLYATFYVSKSASYFIAFAFLLFTIIMNYHATYHYEINDPTAVSVLSGTDPSGLEGWANTYFRPWTRGAPFIIGALSGMYFRQTEDEKSSHRLSTKHATYVQFGACALLLFLATIDWDENYLLGKGNGWPRWLVGTYLAFARLFWGVGLSIFTFSILYCETPGIISSFLSLEIFGVLSKLCFSTYLIHFPLYQFRGAQNPIQDYYTPWNELELWLGHSCVSITFAFFLFILIEYPFSIFEKALFTKPKKTKPYEPLRA